MGGCWKSAADNNVARIKAGTAVYKGVASSLLKGSSVQSRKISVEYTLLLPFTCGLPARSQLTLHYACCLPITWPTLSLCTTKHLTVSQRAPQIMLSLFGVLSAPAIIPLQNRVCARPGFATVARRFFEVFWEWSRVGSQAPRRGKECQLIPTYKIY